MAKYNWPTIDRYIMMVKQDIKDALQGKVDGKAASKEECDNLVLDTFDTVVFHLTTGSKAMRRYMACKEEERKHNNYKYEGNENDD